MNRCFHHLLQYALNAEGRLVFIEDVNRGDKCGCVCPYCKEALRARKGKKNAHSFAHKSGIECIHSYESSLHYLAKKILEEGGLLTLPSLEDEENDSGYKKTIVKEGTVIKDPAKILVEEKIGEIVPDILIVMKGNNKLIVEIAVTHKVDEEKKRKIQQLGISAIGFDLSGIQRDITEPELRMILEKGEKSYWLFNKKYESNRRRKTHLEENVIIQDDDNEFNYKKYKIIYANGYDPYIENPPCNYGTTFHYGKKIKHIKDCQQCYYFVGFMPYHEKNRPSYNGVVMCKLRPGNTDENYPFNIESSV